MSKQKIKAVKDFCINELREVQTDNLYFGEDKNGKSQGSIYWIPGAETWSYLCNDQTEYGKCDNLLDDIDDKILLSYYKSNKKEIDEWIEDQKENRENKFELRA